MLGAQCLMFVIVCVTLAGAIARGRRVDARYGSRIAAVLALLLLPKVSERPFVAPWAVLAWTRWLCQSLPGDLPDEPSGRSFRRRL